MQRGDLIKFKEDGTLAGVVVRTLPDGDPTNDTHVEYSPIHNGLKGIWNVLVQFVEVVSEAR